VITKLVGISRGASYFVDYIQGPPSPSKTLILETTLGRTVCIGTAGGGELIGAEDGMGGGEQKSTLSPHIWKDMVPACMLISAPAVAVNGLPKMIGI